MAYLTRWIMTEWVDRSSVNTRLLSLTPVSSPEQSGCCKATIFQKFYPLPSPLVRSSMSAGIKSVFLQGFSLVKFVIKYSKTRLKRPLKNRQNKDLNDKC